MKTAKKIVPNEIVLPFLQKKRKGKKGKKGKEKRKTEETKGKKILLPSIHAFSDEAVYLKLNETYAEFNWPVCGHRPAGELLCHVSIKKSCL